MRATFARYNLSWDFDKTPGQTNPPNNTIDIVLEYSLTQMISGQCDVFVVQSYNEYAQLMLTHKTPGVLYRPSDVNAIYLEQPMLEDMIIAGTDWLQTEEHQDWTIRFLRASFRGWIYARANPQLSVELFADKSALQQWSRVFVVWLFLSPGLT